MAEYRRLSDLSSGWNLGCLYFLILYMARAHTEWSLYQSRLRVSKLELEELSAYLRTTPMEPRPALTVRGGTNWNFLICSGPSIERDAIRREGSIVSLGKA